jgi:hypothetical protein
MEERAALSVGEQEYFDFKQPGYTPDADLTCPARGSDILEGSGGPGRRTPNFTPEGRTHPAQTLVRTAVRRLLLARRR